jgi:hypothetical protein
VQLAASASLDVPVVFHPPASDSEEIVFIEVSAPQHDRRPITVFGSTP